MRTGRYWYHHAEDRGEEKHNGNHETEVLLVRRAKAPEIGKWTVPGGSLELGEDIHTCMCSQRAVHTRSIPVIRISLHRHWPYTVQHKGAHLLKLACMEYAVDPA